MIAKTTNAGSDGASLTLPAGQSLLLNGEWSQHAEAVVRRDDVLRSEFRFEKPWPFKNLTPGGFSAVAMLGGWLVLCIAGLAVGQVAGVLAGVIVALMLACVSIGLAFWANPAQRTARLGVGIDGVYAGGWRMTLLAWPDITAIRAEGSQLVLEARGRAAIIDTHSATVSSQLAKLLQESAAAALAQRLPRSPADGALAHYRSTPQPDEQDLLLALSDGRLPLARRIEAARGLANSDDTITRQRATTMIAACAAPRIRKALNRAMRPRP